MVKYNLINDEFVIENYDRAKTFSSFLPGIAGKKGIPLWSFYVNRGQGLCSFGVKDKNSPILEFFPANTSYQYVSTYGFRSFIKEDGKIYEPFKVDKNDKITRYMKIKSSSFSIEEVNELTGIKYTVTYFGMPNEQFGAIVRKVEIENISSEEKNISVVDGLATLFPYGVENGTYKEISNLVRSWMEVYNIDTQIPYYKLRASTGDEAEIKEIEKGNFYLSFDEDNKVFDPIVDAKLVFDFDTSMNYPYFFEENSTESILNTEQVTANKVPCGMTIFDKKLSPGQKYKFATIIGHTMNYDELVSRKGDIANYDFIETKEKEAEEIISEITNDVETASGNSLFNEYAKQNYLDNVLRGGYPYIIKAGNNKFVYHLYSRKHGDLERDYNFFTIDPEFFSQGNGNFRDVNQNRRNDIMFFPEIEDYNVKTFMSLIQVDGYNPLSVKGSTFKLEDVNIAEIANEIFLTHTNEMVDILSKSFTPGNIINYINNNGVQLKVTEEEMFEIIFSKASHNIEASFGEGYWVDHWTYNMDLVENYIYIYPDRLQNFVFEDMKYKYFDSPVYVLPRNEKYVLNSKGNVRQYGSNIHDEEKMQRNNMSIDETNWLRTSQGTEYSTNLFEKLLSLAINKFALLDPEGLGIEMEANKPGWNDAMNGLPGLFGSGMSETIELVRVIKFLLKQVAQFGALEVSLMEELVWFINEIEKTLDSNITGYDYWNQIADIRERYREKVRFEITGDQKVLRVNELESILNKINNKLEIALEKALELGKGIMPTYFYYEAEKYEVIKDSNGNNEISHYGLPKVEVKSFKLKQIPFFLEAPARAMKAIDEKNVLSDMYEKVKKSGIYDKELMMYKTSDSLDEESNEIGRIRAFTAGWLERESIFLHMTYKYVLGLLKAGLYEQYFEEIKTNLVCFLESEAYGRSVLENSSFIASSNNPDPSTHHQGFVARLSGSTSEFLSMWLLMVIGKKGFTYENETLRFEFEPVIPAWLLDDNGSFSFKLFRNTNVTYNRCDKTDILPNTNIKSIVVDGVALTSPYLEGEYAEKLRKGLITNIVIKL